MARYTEQIFPVKKLVPLTAEIADRISEYRHTQRISSENEAIRRLIEAGLTVKPGADDSGTPGGSEIRATRKSAASPKRAPTAKSG
jgi:hypothetical protein